MIKILAFDLFNTILRLNKAKKKDLKSYANQIEENLDEWGPFDLPDSWAWELELYDDAIEGLKILRENFALVTFSNAPAKLQLQMIRNHNLPFDAITPLELFEMSKPALPIYREMALWGYPLAECGMVTANKTFGDLEGAKECGMMPLLIRDPSSEIQNLLDLNNYLLSYNKNAKSDT